MKRDEILREAQIAVVQRGENYGSPAENFQRIADLWTNLTGHNITIRDVGNMMIALKMARLQETPDHKDSWVDIAGYAAVTAEAIAEISDSQRPLAGQQNTDSTIQVTHSLDQ